MRRAAAAIIGPVIGLLLAGCATVCPAIGWSNGITIDSSAFGEGVFLQVCSDAGCSAGPGAQPTPESDSSIPVQGDAGAFFFGFAAPDRITVRVYDSAGALLAESDEPIDWTHSTDPCGGPSTAPPIVLKP